MIQNLKQGTGHKKKKMEDQMKWGELKLKLCHLCQLGQLDAKVQEEMGQEAETGHWTREERMEDTMR
jgi:hypothetical protein